MDIDLKLLQHAVVLAKHRHFGRAAHALGVSQPTLSRNIAALEKRLGMRVFERSRTDIASTPAGSDVLRMAEELVSRAEAISNRLDMVRGGRGGHLRVVAASYICDLAVYPAVIEMLNSDPPINIEVMEREWTGTLDMVHNDQADFAVMDTRWLGKVPNLRFDVAGSLQAQILCRAGHPLLTKKVIQPEDISEYRFVFQRRAIDWRFDTSEFDTYSTVDEVTGSLVPSVAVSSCRGMFQIVAKTDAITIAFPSQVQDEINAGRLAFLPYNLGERGLAQFGFAYKRQRTPLPSVRAFMSLVRKQLRIAAK
jgi:DNA-binding transcriptional LysR family regulator